MTNSPATIVVCDGDETGQELLVEALRALAPDVLGVPLELVHYDLSLESRRSTNNQVVHDAAAAMLETSKAHAKRFMQRHAIPTAAYAVCESRHWSVIWKRTTTRGGWHRAALRFGRSIPMESATWMRR